MLINFSFKNVSSFKEAQNLSLEASPLKKDDILSNNLIIPDEKNRILKSALIYGANASGKTNMISAISWFKRIVLTSYGTLDHNVLRQVIPFLLDGKSIECPSDFEVVFFEDDIKYRYGISIFDGEIVEEWLYYTITRETLLLLRKYQTIEYNKTQLEEAKPFVKKGKNSDKKAILGKTASNVPFISALAAFQSKHGLNVINFFSKIHTISGIKDERLGGYSFSLLKEDLTFYNWALDKLKNFDITGLIVNEEKISGQGIPFHPFSRNVEEEISFLDIRVKKQLSNSKGMIEFPLALESSGTCKIIHLLGPLYKALENGDILFIDEFDSQFHTLLSKYIFNLFHITCKNAQIITNVQDTNLMNTDIFRRDQIWFVHKDKIEKDSNLYSLAEYKNAIQKSYSEDYLHGAFDAIPLFDSIDDIEKLMKE